MRAHEVWFHTDYLGTNRGEIDDAYLAENIQHNYGLAKPPDSLKQGLAPGHGAVVARYMPDHKAPDGHHALSQLTQAGSPEINNAFPDAEANYNLAAMTRMDWRHNAHILETFATHGGRDALAEYFSRSPHMRDDLELNYLENRAKQVFAKLKYFAPREDLKHENW